MDITAGLKDWNYFREAWRAVATAKIDEFEYQCRRLAELARCGAVNSNEAATVLTDIAEAHSLEDTFGKDCVAVLIADAFAQSEAAA